MTTYAQQFAHLHGKYLKPKKLHGHPGGEAGGGGGGGQGARRAKPSGREIKHYPPYKGQLPPPTPDADSLGIPDLPPEVAAIVAQILAQDPEGGADRAFAYIRGTDWFKTSYAGFDQGAASGLWSSDLSGLTSYRGWRGGTADAYKRYYGTDATSADYESWAAQGFDASRIEGIGQGHAWAQANSADVQWELSAYGGGKLSGADLELLGQQEAGVQSSAGAAFQARLQAASARASRIFEGVLATPGLSIGSGGLTAPSLLPKQKPDVGA